MYSRGRVDSIREIAIFLSTLGESSLHLFLWRDEGIARMMKAARKDRLLSDEREKKRFR